MFCAEHTENFIPNSVNTGIAFVPTDEKVKKACKVAYLGWYKKYNNLVFSMDEFQKSENYNLRKDYAFTQQLVWETLEQSSANFIDSNVQKEYEQFKADINKKIEEIERKPSFNNQTINLDAGEEKTLVDENNILSEYCNIDKELDGVRVIHIYGENTLKIKVSENCNITQIHISEEMMNSLGLIKEETKQNNTTIYLEFNQGVQNQIYSLNYNSPVSFSINLQITPYGNLELKKINKEGNLIDGSIFEITGPENFYKEVQVANGNIKLEKLKIGKYQVKEKTAPTGYLINEKIYNVEIKPGETSCLEILNDKPTGTLIVHKKIEFRKNIDKCLINTIDYSQISFKLIAKEDIKDELDGKVIYKKESTVKIFNLNKNGNAEIADLPMGIYELQEIKTVDGLILDKEEYEIKFEQKDQHTKIYFDIKDIENKTTEVQISKKDITGTNEELIGAKLSVIDENENIVDSWITTENVHKIEGLTAGKKYILREESAPLGYKISEDITFIVNDDGRIQKVEMKDYPLFTKIQIEKLDKDTKEHIKEKIFSFGIYEDEECTKLIKKVDANLKNGTVLFDNLRYGTYYLKEIEAPTGYSLSQEIVKFEINDRGVYANNENLNEKDGVYSIDFLNSKLPEIQTSDESKLGILIFVAVISFITANLIIIKMLKKND